MRSQEYLASTIEFHNQESSSPELLFFVVTPAQLMEDVNEQISKGNAAHGKQKRSSRGLSISQLTDIGEIAAHGGIRDLGRNRRFAPPKANICSIPPAVTQFVDHSYKFTRCQPSLTVPAPDIIPQNRRFVNSQNTQRFFNFSENFVQVVWRSVFNNLSTFLYILTRTYVRLIILHKKLSTC